jgi:hypothetical protein
MVLHRPIETTRVLRNFVDRGLNLPKIRLSGTHVHCERSMTCDWLSRNWDIAVLSSSSSAFHVLRGALLACCAKLTIRCSSGDESSNSHRWIRMCVASSKTLDCPPKAFFTDSAARASLAASFEIGESTPISLNAASMSAEIKSLATTFVSPASFLSATPSKSN